MKGPSLQMSPQTLSETKTRKHLQNQRLLERRLYHFCCQKKYSQHNQSSTLQHLHFRTANQPLAKSANSLISNPSRPKTSSVATSSSVFYKTIGPSSLPNTPRQAKVSENPGSLVDEVSKVRLQSHAGRSVVALYGKNDERPQRAITSTRSSLGCLVASRDVRHYCDLAVSAISSLWKYFAGIESCWGGHMRICLYYIG